MRADASFRVTEKLLALQWQKPDAIDDELVERWFRVAMATRVDVPCEVNEAKWDSRQSGNDLDKNNRQVHLNFAASDYSSGTPIREITRQRMQELNITEEDVVAAAERRKRWWPHLKRNGASELDSQFKADSPFTAESPFKADSPVQVKVAQVGVVLPKPADYDSDTQEPEIRSVAFSPKDPILCIGYENGQIKLYDVASRKEIRTITRDCGTVMDVAFSPDGRSLAACFWTRCEGVKVWSASSGQEIQTLPISWEVGGGSKLVFARKGRSLAITCFSRFAIMLWDLVSGKGVDLAPAGRTHLSVPLAASPDGRILASGGQDFDQVTLRPDGKFYSSASGAVGAIKLWDLESGEVIHTISGGFGQVKSLAFSPDGRILASGGDGFIMLWEVSSGDLIEKLFRSPIMVHHFVTFSPDGRTLASADIKFKASSSINLWDIASKQLMRTFAGHKFGVKSLSFSPDGHTLASGGGGGVKLWNIDSGEKILSFK